MKKKPKPVVPPVCDCGRTAVLRESSAHLYGGRNYGPVWECPNAACDAYCGCHKGTKQPLGRLANKALRDAKVRAHAAFDPLWKRVMERDGLVKYRARGRGYKWLAAQMGIDAKDAHIGQFTIEQCAQVVAICTSLKKESA